MGKENVGNNQCKKRVFACQMTEARGNSFAETTTEPPVRQGQQYSIGIPYLRAGTNTVDSPTPQRAVSNVSMAFKESLCSALAAAEAIGRN